MKEIRSQEIKRRKRSFGAFLMVLFLLIYEVPVEASTMSFDALENEFTAITGQGEEYYLNAGDVINQGYFHIEYQAGGHSDLNLTDVNNAQSADTDSYTIARVPKVKRWNVVSIAGSAGHPSILYLKPDYDGNQYTVTYVDEDGTELQKTEGLYYNDKVPAYNEETPEKQATAEYTYTFSGWDKQIADYVTGDVTYIATYTKTVKKYNVTFDTNGHGNAPDNQSIEYGSKVLKPADLSWEGYIFGGWYTDNTCKTAWNFDTDTVTADTTLYAKWTRKQGNYSPNGALVFEKGSNKDIELVIKREENDEICYDLFKSVYIGDTLLTEGIDYTSKRGSTIITFKAATLEKMDVGEYKVSVLFDDGMATVGLLIKEAAGKIETTTAAPAEVTPAATAEVTPAATAETSKTNDKSPKTGDEVPVFWLLMIMTGSVVGILYLNRKKNKI